MVRPFIQILTPFRQSRISRHLKNHGSFTKPPPIRQKTFCRTNKCIQRTLTDLRPSC
jgi:hypothetical protein